MSKDKISAPKGVPDYIPPVSAEFIAVRDTFAHQARLAGYEHIELPVFEETALFARGVGESTDVVSKEMYTFEDRGGRSATLRPEGTAGVMRAVIEHNLDRGQLPVKLNYYGPFFRYERPQAGRYRQLQQVGVEAIGVDDPALDAEVIALADRCFRSIGLNGFRLELTSLGDHTCRPQYREKLQEFLFKLPLDEETRRRAEINPLRVLDDKREEVREMTADAPLMIDHLSDQAREHFETVTGLLDDLGVQYVINPRMVRGLDYYTKTTFEFVHDGLGAQSGIGGGGRYDGLMAQLGGQELSGIGFGLGVDRALLALQAEQRTVTDGSRVDAFGVAMGAPAKAAMVKLIDALRAAGIRADMSYGDRGLKGAMKGADRAGARFALVLGDRELEQQTVMLKDLRSHEQQEVSIDSLVRTIAEQL
ncbi:histidine--tRNA ligase [Corynebacterium sp. 153RC1]|uniref:histidine--tRNA ligase n=1 Tax=unclassified Corynebacterium TaxID=2624378 RepID=UPI00211C5FF6|nr:histidine--tRNA ligase [Corynebacterium sp. 209RC1]MCQ9354620.1 histidine--tRNA ligase [Corynebacterium sp. 1222RC1]MCQ9357528.1 histidine--tRNA ligase [Corynebacterium sp. 122RC1]MCQ9358018.1 histidine--tRNA ligase [Corynebacterium sp. 142RC1]MCQ9360378.1 histidine--tRNA ligase [Corynebacterium sp. 153RC1]MCQ9362302.1 histidine--tRNA ligase [Corynebacterium sp. 732RC1]MCQ9365274.1 histidine--tRNA ligase [Corynebacterium sp. 70RC1]MCQ9369663.1 histidine--tRNA ligase [Corynebacterium sp. 3